MISVIYNGYRIEKSDERERKHFTNDKEDSSQLNEVSEE